jgi:Holliday junction DNA helicase RuvB
MNYYTTEELTTILMRSANVLCVGIEPEGAAEIAGRSRGTPRIANRFLKRLRDFAEVRYNGVITKDMAKETLTLLGVDESGLDQDDRKILSTIIDKFNGGPVGLETLAAAIGEEANTLEDVYEPFLIMSGFLERTSRGRMATVNAYKHLKKTLPKDKR